MGNTLCCRVKRILGVDLGQAAHRGFERRCWPYPTGDRLQRAEIIYVFLSEARRGICIVQPGLLDSSLSANRKIHCTFRRCQQKFEI